MIYSTICALVMLACGAGAPVPGLAVECPCLASHDASDEKPTEVVTTKLHSVDEELRKVEMRHQMRRNASVAAAYNAAAGSGQSQNRSPLDRVTHLFRVNMA